MHIYIRNVYEVVYIACGVLQCSDCPAISNKINLLVMRIAGGKMSFVLI